jgi:aminoglycoside phosphotransferase (APT) family kinase protein
MTAPAPAPDDALARALQALAHRLVAGGSGIARLRRLSGGAVQETFAFDVCHPDGAQPMVLRRARNALRNARPYGVSLTQEAHAIRLAGEGGVPVSRVIHELSGAEGAGEGFVSAFVAGETIPRRIQRDERLAVARDRFAEDCGRILAALHRLDGRAFPFLETVSPAQAVSRMDAQYRALDRPGPVFELALRWLGRRAPPAPSALAVVHGDFRLGNLMMRDDGIAAVLDWEGVHLGDPAADLAYLTLRSWRFGQPDKAVGGLGTRRDLMTSYAAAGGVAPSTERLRFWEVAHTLWWGLVCADMARQFTSRADFAVERGAVGRRRSEAEIDLLCLLDREATP